MTDEQAFEKAYEDPAFEKAVLNRCVPHTDRTEPAWVYSLRDASFGYQWAREQSKKEIEALKKELAPLNGHDAAWIMALNKALNDSSEKALRELTQLKERLKLTDEEQKTVWKVKSIRPYADEQSWETLRVQQLINIIERMKGPE